MGTRVGSIDPNITGNLTKKFGDSMPVPFIENVTIKDDGIDVTLTMYFNATEEQIENKTRFKNSIKNMGLNVYFMLLVSETNSDLRNNDANYNYEKFLKNINKKTVNTANILNYITPTFYALPGDTVFEGNRPVASVLTGVPEYPLIYRNTFPQRGLQTIVNNCIEVSERRETHPSHFSFYNINSLFSSLGTNTYKVELSEFEISDVFYSKDETPIITMSATTTLSSEHAKCIF